MSVLGKQSILEAKETVRLFLNVPQQGVPFMRSTPGVGKSAIVYQLAVEKVKDYLLGAAKCEGCKAGTGDPSKHIRGCGAFHPTDGCSLCIKGFTKSTIINGVPVVSVDRAPAHIRVDDIRLSLFDPIEVKGLPIANTETGLTQWLCPEYLNTDDEVYSILFLDEYGNAAPAVQNASLQLVYDKRSHKHALSKRCMIILAANTEGDGTHVAKISSALNNRVGHLEIQADPEDFLKWARDNGIHMAIIGAVSTYPDTLLPSKFDKSLTAQPTPRTWEILSRMIDQTGAVTDKQIRRLSLPIIGHGATTEFMAFLGQFQRVKPEEIINEGKMPVYDTEDVSQKYAYSCAVAHWIKTHATDIKQKVQAENIFRFLGTLKQVEMRVKTLQDMNLAAEPRLVSFFRTNANKEFSDLMSRLSTAVADAKEDDRSTKKTK